MNCSAPPFISLVLFGFLVSIKVPSCSGNNYANCRNKFTCGNITADYPFWGNKRPSGCGVPGLLLKCEDDTTKIEIKGVLYHVLEISPETQILRIVREDLSDGLCPPQFVNSTLDFGLFDYVNTYTNVTLVYGCVSVPLAGPAIFTCAINGVNYQSGYVQQGAKGPGMCYNSIFLPILMTDLPALISTPELEDDIKKGFEVKWVVDNSACGACTKSNGACGYNTNSNQFACYCPNQLNGSQACVSLPDAAPANPGMYVPQLLDGAIQGRTSLVA